MGITGGQGSTLEIDGLSKAFGDVTALQECSFAAHPGRLTGFVGPNGAGKTTTMRAVFGLVVPDRGEIRWAGERVRPAQRRRFGYMPEERGLYPKMPLHEQVTHFGFLAGLDRDAAAQNADRWLEDLGLGERRDTPIEELSHGNQQRAQLAVALVHDPDLLVLDEPFSGLDPVGVDDLGRMMQEIARKGRTVLFSSHQLDLVEDLCDEVVMVNQGRVVLSGGLRELRNRAERRHLYLETSNGHSRWYEDLSGVTVVDESSGEVELTVDWSLDLSKVVELAESDGEIHRLEYRPPSLSQMFLEAVRS